MATSKLKNELQRIADCMPESATYADVMDALYIRMKVSKGREDVEAGRVVDHEEVKRRFVK